MDEFVARQPIFDGQRELYGYEVLFRSGLENAFGVTDSDHATARVMTQAMHLKDLAAFTGGMKCFFNITRRVLLEELYAMLPPEDVVLELPETIEIDADVIAACRKLRRAGYVLALDDYALEAHLMPILPLLNILKVDFVQLTPTQRREAVRQGRANHLALVAEKVETHEDFRQGVRMGYSLFQGYFFCEPEILQQRDLPVSRLTQIRLLEHLHKDTIDLDKVDEIIRQDLGLSYKLLRLLNSAAFSFRSEITSIKRALVLMGDRPLRKWASLIVLSQLSEEKPQELLNAYMIRARFCESFAAAGPAHGRAGDYFMLGMFSLIDAILDQPMSEVLQELALPEDVVAALLGEDGELRQALELAIAMERGEWGRIAQTAAALRVQDSDLARMYHDAIAWAASLSRQWDKRSAKSAAA